MTDSYNQAWKRLFSELGIQDQLEQSGAFRLSAEKIKSVTAKEARIMAKWDSREARPEILRDAGVTILPTSRSGYTLIRGDGYCDLPLSEAATYHSPRKLGGFTTLPWKGQVTRESLAIDVAQLSSMLKAFTGETELALTIRGRSGTSNFGFDFQGMDRIHHIEVDRAQIEVDAGFEGDSVWLIEAKIGEPDDFLVRQLFYPWRAWKTQTPKEVHPVFLCYANRAFGFVRYRFNDSENYHSIELVKKQWFTLDEPEGIESLIELFHSTKPGTPGIRIFPQADTLGTVVAAIEIYAEEASNTADVSARLGLDPRQGQYYTTAAEWIGLVERDASKRRLSAEGKEFIASSRTRRFKILFRAIAATPIFRDVIDGTVRGEELDAAEIAKQIRSARYADGSTAPRRAQTVLAWIEWLWREHANLAAGT